MKRIEKAAKEHAERLCESRAAISSAIIDFEAGARWMREALESKVGLPTPVTEEDWLEIRIEDLRKFGEDEAE